MEQSIRVTLPLDQQGVAAVADAAFTLPYRRADRLRIARYFPSQFVPGTFLVSERKNAPPFLYDEPEPSYYRWLAGMVRSHMWALGVSLTSRSEFSLPCADDVEKAVVHVFDHCLEGGKAVCERITNQQATDFTSRCVNILCRGHAYAPNESMRAFNLLGKQYALELLRRMHPTQPESAIRLSVIAGAVGVDIKARYIACGPSRVVSDGMIPLGNETAPNSVELIQAELESRLGRSFAIDDVIPFLQEVYCSPSGVRLVLFADDLIETVFDLYWVQRLLETDHKLNVFLVPRWGSYANDASFADVLDLVSRPLFEYLRNVEGVRFHVVAHGPTGSAVNPFEFSTEVAQLVDSADCLLFKGARAYEMLQGIRKSAYFAFNVLRSYTESLTGFDSMTYPSLFIRQVPGIPSFCDFRARAYRKKTFANGRVVGLARMTSAEYSNAVKKIQQEVNAGQTAGFLDVASSAFHQAEREDRTFAEVVLPGRI